MLTPQIMPSPHLKWNSFDATFQQVASKFANDCGGMSRPQPMLYGCSSLRLRSAVPLALAPVPCELAEIAADQAKVGSMMNGSTRRSRRVARG
jgi:hypothetical protein